LASIPVRLLDSFDRPVKNPMTGEDYILTTDNNGKYKFENLPAGQYKVKFEIENYYISPQNTTSDDKDSDIDPAIKEILIPYLISGENSVNNDVGVKSLPKGKSSSKRYKRNPSYVCKDPSAINYSPSGVSDRSLCKYEKDDKEDLLRELKEKLSKLIGSKKIDDN
jgi:hypothetical protein